MNGSCIRCEPPQLANRAAGARSYPH